MNYSKNCPFCINSRLENNRLANLPTNDTILFQNKNIYVQVDISPLTIGHILIISNYHYLNFYEMPKEIKEDVIKIKEKLKIIYKNLYNTDILFFEHGSAQSGYAGTSIDHAHLHCIPCFNNKLDIKNTLNKMLGDNIECDILANYDFNNQFSYIYIESEKDGKVIYKVNRLPSQFLRKLILEKLGDNNFLWQEKCITPNSINKLKQTIIDFKSKISI